MGETMKTKLIFLLLFAASMSFGQTWVYPPTGNNNGPYSLPCDGAHGALVYNVAACVPAMLANGWRIQIAPPDVSSDSVRYWNTPNWIYDANGSNADASYVDWTTNALNAIAASNAAVQAAIAASNAIINAIAWTNAMTNAWLSVPVKTAAQEFRQVWTNYTALGSITNPTITYQAAIPLFMNQGTNVTSKQISDCLLWEWAYSPLSPFLNIYFPPTGGSNTWPMIQNAPWSLLP